MKFDRVMGCGLGWFVGPNFLSCDRVGLGWVSRLVGWVGLNKLDPRTTLRAIEELLLTYLLTYLLTHLLLGEIGTGLHLCPCVDLEITLDISPRGNESAPRVSL